MKPYVLLIHPLYGQETQQRIFQPGVEAPISLAYLSAYMERTGIENDILDLRIAKRPIPVLRNKIDAKQPLAVGITASTAAIENAASIARSVKAMNPEIFTIIGGWHASALPEETLKTYPQFDFLVHGEGEFALEQLVRSLANGKTVENLKGLAYRTNGTVQINPRAELISNLDEIPFPARHKMPMAKYHPNPATRNYVRLPTTGILVGRGCPYHCLFCYKGVWGSRVRFRSVESVLEELEICIERHGIRDFRFYDDTLTFPRWDLKKFCEELIDRKLNISWNCWSRVNSVDEDKLRLMKAAGCYHIKYGIEFGTEKALRIARKGATLEQARQAIADAKKVGLECKGSFILGIPGETLEDCRQTIEFALDVAPHFATFYAFDPIPGSPFYQQLNQGEIDPQRDLISSETTHKLADEAYRAFYFRLAFVAQRLKSLCLRPQLESRMLLNGMQMMASYLFNGNFQLQALSANQRHKSSTALVQERRSPIKLVKMIRKGIVRSINVLVSLIGLVLTMPIMAVIALAIKISSPGPAIFKQTRIGQDRRRNNHSDVSNERLSAIDRRMDDLGGRPFHFYKFRTMYVDAKDRFPELYKYEYSPEEVKKIHFKIPDDPRLTRFGEHLRKTTLDELPNLINVIKGDMNLIGPRPDIPEMVKYYEDWQKKKFLVKPGVTGISQVNGRGLLSFQETLRLDVEYVENKSVWMNIKVLLKTIKVTLQRIGAF
jgi:anaerobic magnesium-protoporphyrin IX monomethyl ester cyclase